MKEDRMRMNNENSDCYNHKDIGDLFMLTLRQGEHEAEERVSFSALAEKGLLPLHNARGTARALTNSAPGTTGKTPGCKVCAAMLPDLL